MNKPDFKSALCIGGSLLSGLIFKVLEISMFKNSYKLRDSEINEMLFYGAEDEEQTRKTGMNNQLCVNYVILHASSTVDVCVPSLSSDTLAKCLVSVKQKNKVHVRIAIHDSDDFHNLQLFAQCGVEVKVIKPGVRLAHEFVLIDACACDALALMGGLEPAPSGLWGAATLLTSDSVVLSALNREFERVWNSVTETTCAKPDKTD